MSQIDQIHQDINYFSLKEDRKNSFNFDENSSIFQDQSYNKKQNTSDDMAFISTNSQPTNEKTQEKLKKKAQRAQKYRDRLKKEEQDLENQNEDFSLNFEEFKCQSEFYLLQSINPNITQEIQKTLQMQENYIKNFVIISKPVEKRIYKKRNIMTKQEMEEYKKSIAEQNKNSAKKSRDNKKLKKNLLSQINTSFNSLRNTIYFQYPQFKKAFDPEFFQGIQNQQEQDEKPIQQLQQNKNSISKFQKLDKIDQNFENKEEIGFSKIGKQLNADNYLIQNQQMESSFQLDLPQEQNNQLKDVNLKKNSSFYEEFNKAQEDYADIDKQIDNDSQINFNINNNDNKNTYKQYQNSPSQKSQQSNSNQFTQYGTNSQSNNTYINKYQKNFNSRSNSNTEVLQQQLQQNQQDDDNINYEQSFISPDFNLNYQNSDRIEQFNKIDDIFQLQDDENDIQDTKNNKNYNQNSNFNNYIDQNEKKEINFNEYENQNQNSEKNQQNNINNQNSNESGWFSDNFYELRYKYSPFVFLGLICTLIALVQIQSSENGIIGLLNQIYGHHKIEKIQHKLYQGQIFKQRMNKIDDSFNQILDRQCQQLYLQPYLELNINDDFVVNERYEDDDNHYQCYQLIHRMSKMFKEIGYINKYLIYTRQAYILQLQGVYSTHQEEKSSELLYTYALMKNGHYEKTLQQLKKIKPQNQSEELEFYLVKQLVELQICRDQKNCDQSNFNNAITLLKQDVEKHFNDAIYSFIKIEMLKNLYQIYHQESFDDFNLIKESEKMRYYIEMIYLNSQEEDCVCPPYYDLLQFLAEMIYEFKNDPLQAIKINEINYEKQMEVYCPDSPMVQQTRRQNKKFWYYYLKQNENILDMQYYDLMQRLEKYAKLDPKIEIMESEENLDDQYFYKIQQSEILGLNNN